MLSTEYFAEVTQPLPPYVLCPCCFSYFFLRRLASFGSWMCYVIFSDLAKPITLTLCFSLLPSSVVLPRLAHLPSAKSEKQHGTITANGPYGRQHPFFAGRHSEPETLPSVVTQNPLSHPSLAVAQLSRHAAHLLPLQPSRRRSQDRQSQHTLAHHTLPGFSQKPPIKQPCSSYNTTDRASSGQTRRRLLRCTCDGARYRRLSLPILQLAQPLSLLAIRPT